MSGGAEAAWAQYQAQQSGSNDAEAAWKAYQSQSQPTTIDVKGPVSVQGSPNSVLSAIANNPITNTVANLGQTLGTGIAQNASEAGSGLENIGAKILKGWDSLLGTAKPNDPLTQENKGAYNWIGQSPNPSISQGVNLASSLLLPGAQLKSVVKGAQAIPKIGKAIAPFIPTAATGAAYGGLYGAANNDSNLLSDTLLGASLPVGLQALGRGLGAALPGFVTNRLNKVEQQSKLPYSKVNSPAQAQQVLQAGQDLGVGNIPLSIGALTNAPGYKSWYNAGSKFPLANQQQKMQEVVGKADQGATNLYNSLFNNKGADIQKTVGDINQTYAGLKKPFEDNKEGTGIYQKFFNKADAAGIKGVERPNVQSRVQKELDDLKEAQDNNLTHYLKTASPEVKNLLQDLSKPIGRENPSTGKFENQFGLSKLKEERTKIREVRDKQEKGSPEYKLFNDLYNAADQDISYNLDKSGNKALKNEFDKITNDYKTKVVPFQDIQDVLSGKYKNSNEVINTLLDQRNRAALNLLPPNVRKQIAGHKLIGATQGEDVNSTKLVKGYQNLEPSDKSLISTLLSPSDISKFESLGALNKGVSSAKVETNEPETGRKLIGWLSKAIPVAAGAAGVANPILAAKLATVGGLAAMGNRGILNYMTNPALLKAYANPAQRAQLVKQSLGQGGLGAPSAINIPAFISNLMNQ